MSWGTLSVTEVDGKVGFDNVVVSTDAGSFSIRELLEAFNKVRKELSELKGLDERLRWNLRDVLAQAIHPDKEDVYFSGFISTYAEALRFLVEIGEMEMVSDFGYRSVNAKFIGQPFDGPVEAQKQRQSKPNLGS